jgi:Rps23 Pro-64 3,4-dihydroxylase Tpa1-like proline 4-hydroxylase
MNQSLLENGYIVVPNFICSERAKKLSEEFIKVCNENNLSGDSQVPTSKSQYNYISFLELLCEKTPNVSSIIGETVLPTYSYARVYEQGSVLSSHTDRKECEISITVNLDSDIVWPIWVIMPNGKQKKITLNPGDGLIYLGIDIVHWREEFAGSYCSQVFLHYVRSRGPNAPLYFDKDNKQFCNFTEIKKSPEVIVKTENYKSKNPLDSYIKIYYSAIPEDVCDLILKEYQNCEDWNPSRTGNGEVNKFIRNCDTIGLSMPDVINKNIDARKQIDSLLFEYSGNTLKQYVEEFPHCQLISDSGYDLLRYNPGGYYSIHTDSHKTTPRTVSCSFNLNDDYEGGEFAFFDREVIIKAPKGSAIVFPSNFMYPHEVMEVKSGSRYSIVTWFV